MRKKLLELSFLISVRCRLCFLSKIVFKTISNQLNILVGCNLSFTKSLNTSYFEVDG